MLICYADARFNQGSWLIQIDDIDTPRIVNGASSSILNSLKTLGFEWDEPIRYQSDNKHRYIQVIEKLRQQRYIYPCFCTRKDIKAISPNGIYSGTCRGKIPQQKITKKHSLRVDTSINLNNSVKFTICFDDLIQGKQQFMLKSLSGDFIVQRSDKIIAYLLAFVIDIKLNKITHIVRGSDLLDSTPKQIFLQQLLNYSIPQYAHIPVICNKEGVKLSKSCAANRVSPSIDTLIAAAEILGQTLDKQINDATIKEFWQELLTHWDIHKIPQLNKIFIGDINLNNSVI